MKSGASESSYFFLEEHYKFPNNVIVSHLPQELIQSNKQYKILWSQHSYDQPVYLNFDFSICDLIVCPSNWLKEQFIKYHKIPEHKLKVIPTGVSKQFTYSNKKSKTFIYTSIPYKGLEVLARIIPHIPEATFKIFSAMNLYDMKEDSYTELYEYLKSLPNVIYSPAVDQQELIEHLQDAAFFVHPNIWEETFCVSLAEAMACGCFPILTDIGALPEVSNEIANIVPMEGIRTSKGYEVTDNFLNNFINACKSALHFFDNDKNYYNQISQSASRFASETYDWKRIADIWKNTIQSLVGEQMTDKKFNQLTVITPEEAAKNEDYLKFALEEVLRWEEEDKELAQGRTNFQIEKFFLLEQYTVPSAFHAALKNRRILAEGYMQKIIEIKERVREFEYKWEDKDKTKPVEWSTRGPNGGTKLCWYDIEQIEMTHYLKSTELEIRDRIQQMNMFDKILNKLVEMNGGPVTREQFEEDDNVYWERRFAEQAMDEMISSRTGISIGNIHSMRRGTAPTLVSDDVNRIKNGYGSIAEAMNNPDAFLNGLQEKVLSGIGEVTGTSLDQLIPGAPNQQLLESRE